MVLNWRVTALKKGDMQQGCKFLELLAEGGDLLGIWPSQ